MLQELIPEFYYLPDMFTNVNQYNLGRSDEQGGEVEGGGRDVATVELPPWANTPEDFVRISRMVREKSSCMLYVLFIA